MSLLSFLFPKTFQYTSRIHGTLKVGKTYGQKALFGGGVTQSGGEFVVMWDAVVKDIAVRRKVKKFLLLGVGAGTMIATVRTYFPAVAVTGVDKDPIMIAIAKEHFGLTHKKTKIYVADALEWVQTQKEKYDLIGVDLYVGKHNIPGSRREFFLRNVSSLLTQNGILVFNSEYAAEKEVAFKRFVGLCKKLFASVEIVFSYRLNKVLVMQKK